MEPEDQNAPWAQCYAHFGLSDTEFDIEIAGLKLAFFLANFGMFRGNATIRNKKLKTFMEIAEICRRYNFLRCLTIQNLINNSERVTAFLEELQVFLNDNEISATDTLVTKIALATTSCVPGYDRFVKIALRNRNISASPSQRGLNQLYAACGEGEILSEFVQNADQTVPIMRSLDRHLLAAGRL